MSNTDDNTIYAITKTEGEYIAGKANVPGKTFYAITNGIPFLDIKKNSRWAFTDIMKVGDSMLVQNVNESTAIRYRMKQNGKDLKTKTYKDDNGDKTVRVWRVK